VVEEHEGTHSVAVAAAAAAAAAVCPLMGPGAGGTTTPNRPPIWHHCASFFTLALISITPVPKLPLTQMRLIIAAIVLVILGIIIAVVVVMSKGK
jgi:hypothetical protein